MTPLKMITNKLLSSFVGIIVALFAITFVVAGTLPVTVNEVIVNDVSSEDSTTLSLSAAPGETVPVVVKFNSDSDLTDLKLKVWVEGYKSDVSASTARFDVVNDSTYIKRLSLTLPSVQDMDDVNEDLTLYVRIADKNDEIEESYAIRLQRDSYAFDVLSVEAPMKASAGEIIALDIVLKNIGARELEDAFVTASISQLGVQRKAYFGDLTPQDDADADKEDARAGRIYLVIPADAKSGDYDLEVKASNYDSTDTVRKVISITGLAVTDDDGKVITPGKTTEEGIPTSIVVLTVVLVIIFVVLLIVLVVLLTKRPTEKVEDFGETSYY